MARFSSTGGSGSGAPGPQGPAGASGDSAYDVAVANGFVGTEQEWLNSLSGGGSADLGDFVFTAGTATVNQNETLNITANDSDEVRAQLVLDPNNGIVKLEAFTNQNYNTFYASNPDWDSSTWVTDGGNGSIITFVNAPNIINFMSTEFNNLNNVKISVNGGASGTWAGGSYGPSDITIYIAGVLPPEDTTINDFSFLYNEVSLIEINQDNGEINIQTQSGNDINISAGDDMYITAQGDDLFLRANDDIRFISTYNDPSLPEQQWTMNSEGQLHFPGNGYISNPANSSGDGYGNDTMLLVPDDNLVSGNGSDQYLIIDPTSPNHIHIRAGGTQDESSAYLILGGERTKVQVSDQDGNVSISSKQSDLGNSYQNMNTEASNLLIIDGEITFNNAYYVQFNGTNYSPAGNYTQLGQTFITVYEAVFQPGEYYYVGQVMGENSWNFSSNGTLYGPAEGLLVVDGLYGTSYQPLVLLGPSGVVLNGDSGEFLNDASIPSNQIATVGNLNDTVSTSMVRYSPTFTATDLTFTGSDTTYPTYNSYYVKAGKMVTFAIEVDCATVTNFGTGQFKLQLPFAPAIGFNHFTGWANVDTTVNPDVEDGHVILNVDHAGLTDILDLHYLKQAGGAHTPIIEGLFLQGTPVILTTSSKIYVNGTYIAA